MYVTVCINACVGASVHGQRERMGGVGWLWLYNTCSTCMHFVAKVFECVVCCRLRV